MRWALGKSAGVDPKARQTRRIRVAGRGARMGCRETPARLSAKSQVRYLAVKCFALPLAAHATPVSRALLAFFYYAAQDGALFPPGRAQVLRKATRMNKQPFVSKAQLDEIIEHYPRRSISMTRRAFVETWRRCATHSRGTQASRNTLR